MCGIAGIVSGDIDNLKPNLKRMTKSLSHRGPDGDGYVFFDRCALGHRRLSIVDLATGDQPMVTKNGKIAVTFNGEVYGYKEIKKKVRFRYRTESDTEVILALYQNYGTKMMSKLPGQFAFAVWDENKKQLFCARDRFGEKPFYYAFGKNGEFIFGSEIKAIISSGLVRPVLDLEVVGYYLQYLHVPKDRTIYKNIYVLPPASTLVYKKNKLLINKYWRKPKVDEFITLSEASEKFSFLMDQAVRRQLVADVPVGAFLSGGLDSTTIVSLASKHHPNIQTFSFGFDDGRDESLYAKEAAKKYGTDHKTLKTNLKNIDGLVVEMARVYDEPFADSSNIPTYLISKLAREHVTVALSGDGGDELLAGYSEWYMPLLYSMNHKTFPGDDLLIRSAKWLTHHVYPSLEKRFEYKLKAIEHAKNPGSLVSKHHEQLKRFSDSELTNLGFDVLNRGRVGNTNSLESVFGSDVEEYMPGDILVKTDRASMAHGLELRSPFLDRDLASFCLSIPHQFKIKNGRDKYLLRHSFENNWPSIIRKRSKQGFGAPVSEWLKLRKIKGLKKDYLSDRSLKLYKMFDYDNLSEYRNADNYKTWIFLNLSIWMETHKYGI